MPASFYSYDFISAYNRIWYKWMNGRKRTGLYCPCRLTWQYSGDLLFNKWDMNLLISYLFVQSNRKIVRFTCHGPLIRYATAGCACAGIAGNVFPRHRLQRKPLVSYSGKHHGTCVTYVPWCMSGALSIGGGENVSGIPGACAPAIFRILQEAHGYTL